MKALLLALVLAACVAPNRPLHSIALYDPPPTLLLPKAVAAAKADGYKVVDIDAKRTAFLAIRADGPPFLVEIAAPRETLDHGRDKCRGSCDAHFTITPLAFDGHQARVLSPIPDAVDDQQRALMDAISGATFRDRDGADFLVDLAPR